MNILVTGGAGFIGSNIADAYIREGHSVVIIDNLSTGLREYINPKAVFYELDILDGKLAEVFRKHKFDIVNHHAGQIDLRKSVEDPGLDINVNVVGSVSLFECAVRNGVRKVIFASTGGAIYGEHDYFPADEEHPVRPYAPYGINKLTVEKYLFYYHHVYGLDYVILRYSNVYGPRQNPFGECGVVAIFTEKMLKKEQPLINGDGEQTRDYVYVDDVVNANILALKPAGEPEMYNVGTSIETSVNHIFDRLNSLSGMNFKQKHGPPKKGEQRRSVLTYKKIRNKLGWEPRIKIDEGLERTIGFFRKKGDAC